MNFFFFLRGIIAAVCGTLWMKMYLGDFCMFCHVFILFFVFSISRFIWRILPFLGRCRQSVTCWVQHLQDCPAGCKTVFRIYWISLIFLVHFMELCGCSNWDLKFTHMHLHTHTHRHMHTPTLRQTRNIHSHLVHMAPLLLFQGEDTYLEGNYALTNKSL